MTHTEDKSGGQTKPKTEIKHIGSRFSGHPNGTIEDLLQLLEIEPLDQNFAPYCSLNIDGSVNIMGNFVRISHSFSLNTKDDDLIASFAAAFDANSQINKNSLFKKDVPTSTKILMGLIHPSADEAVAERQQ